MGAADRLTHDLLKPPRHNMPPSHYTEYTHQMSRKERFKNYNIDIVVLANVHVPDLLRHVGGCRLECHFNISLIFLLKTK